MDASWRRSCASAVLTYQVLYMSAYSRAILSAHGVPEDSHFIPKPFSLKTIALKVRDVLESSRGVGVR